MRRQDGGGSGRAGELLPLLQPPLRLLGMGTPRALLTASCGLGDPEEERGASRWAVPRKSEFPRSEGQKGERERSAGKAQRGQRQLEAHRAPAGAWLVPAALCARGAGHGARRGVPWDQSLESGGCSSRGGSTGALSSVQRQTQPARSSSSTGTQGHPCRDTSGLWVGSGRSVPMCCPCQASAVPTTLSPGERQLAVLHLHPPPRTQARLCPC